MACNSYSSISSQVGQAVTVPFTALQGACRVYDVLFNSHTAAGEAWSAEALQSLALGDLRTKTLISVLLRLGRAKVHSSDVAGSSLFVLSDNM